MVNVLYYQSSPVNQTHSNLDFAKSFPYIFLPPLLEFASATCRKFDFHGVTFIKRAENFDNLLQKKEEEKINFYLGRTTRINPMNILAETGEMQLLVVIEN